MGWSYFQFVGRDEPIFCLVEEGCDLPIFCLVWRHQKVGLATDRWGPFVSFFFFCLPLILISFVPNSRPTPCRPHARSATTELPRLVRPCAAPHAPPTHTRLLAPLTPMSDPSRRRPPATRALTLAAVRGHALEPYARFSSSSSARVLTGPDLVVTQRRQARPGARVTLFFLNSRPSPSLLPLTTRACA